MKRIIVRAASYAGVLIVTIVGVYMTSGRQAGAEPQPAGHDHSTMQSASGATQISLSDADARRIGVTYATATLGPISREVRTVGQISVDETRVRTISSKVDGWVEQLMVGETGQRVRVGQALLAIYSPMLVSAQEELLLARRLLADVGGASAEARRNAEDLLASSRRRLSYWDVSDSEIADIERTGIARRVMVLRSAATGHVIEKTVVSGQKIMSGDALYKVVDLTTVWVEGEVFEQDLANVRVGQPVRADFDALPGTQRAGRIAVILPTLSPDTRTARVRVVLTNHDLLLKPGMYATIRIAGTPRSAVTVPQSAVLSTGERSIVFVRAADNQLLPREVEVGAASDDRIEIRRGLAAGETVVASATFLVDAESNLGTALGGMGNMPGMEITTPPRPLGPRKE